MLRPATSSLLVALLRLDAAVAAQRIAESPLLRHASEERGAGAGERAELAMRRLQAAPALSTTAPPAWNTTEHAAAAAEHSGTAVSGSNNLIVLPGVVIGSCIVCGACVCLCHVWAKRQRGVAADAPPSPRRVFQQGRNMSGFIMRGDRVIYKSSRVQPAFTASQCCEVDEPTVKGDASRDATPVASAGHAQGPDTSGMGRSYSTGGVEGSHERRHRHACHPLSAAAAGHWGAALELDTAQAATHAGPGGSHAGRTSHLLEASDAGHCRARPEAATSQPAAHGGGPEAGHEGTIRHAGHHPGHMGAVHSDARAEPAAAHTPAHAGPAGAHQGRTSHLLAAADAGHCRGRPEEVIAHPAPHEGPEAGHEGRMRHAGHHAGHVGVAHCDTRAEPDAAHPAAHAGLEVGHEARTWHAHHPASVSGAGHFPAKLQPDAAHPVPHAGGAEGGHEGRAKRHSTSSIGRSGAGLELEPAHVATHGGGAEAHYEGRRRHSSHPSASGETRAGAAEPVILLAAPHGGGPEAGHERRSGHGGHSAHAWGPGHGDGGPEPPLPHPAAHGGVGSSHDGKDKQPSDAMHGAAGGAHREAGPRARATSTV